MDTTLTDRITATLISRIQSGKYPVHSRLPTENTMVQEFGVSRTVIREAIARLRSEGLIATKQGSGTIVLSDGNHKNFQFNIEPHKSTQGIVFILELRQGIEAEMAALAALRRTKEQLSKISKALKNIELAVRLGYDGVKEDLAFHMAIAEASNNPHFPALLKLLTHALEDAIKITRGNEATAAHLAEQVKKEHFAIFSAIKSQNPELAKTAAFAHMNNTQKRILSAEESYWAQSAGSATQRLANIDLHKYLFSYEEKK